MDDKLTFKRSSYCADNCCVEVARVPEVGRVLVRNSQDAGEQIEFSVEEWRTFLADVKGNEFNV